MSANWSGSTKWAPTLVAWTGASLGSGDEQLANATSTPTVIGFATSTATLAGAATSTATVAAFATSTPGVSDG